MHVKKSITATVLALIVSLPTFAQNGWTQIVNYPGSGGVHTSGFNSINTGMAGMGYFNTNSNNFTDFWEYSPATNSWTARANFPGQSRYNQSGFYIDKFAYICLGSNAVSYFYDLWEYNCSSNTWMQKANFPGTGRYGAIAQSDGSNAYVGLGERDANGGPYDYFKDFYVYNKGTNAWTQKATFPGQGRYSAFSFFYNGQIYVVGGRTENSSYNWIYLKDMYAYDIASDAWTQKTSYPGQGSMQFGGFVLGDYVYLGTGISGTGTSSDFWKYNPQSDTWVQLANFPGGTRRASFFFHIGNTGYFGGGRSATNIDFRDFWKYEEPAGIGQENIEDQIKLYPVPATECITIEGNDIRYFEIYTANGSLIKRTELCKLQIRADVDISDFASGFYYAKIGVGAHVITRKIIKN
jgi:N-acetylneuraminic acid mutarotase